MLRVFNGRVLAILILACAATACDDDEATTPTAPASPKTVTFSGTVTQNGAATHNFEVGGTGTVTATLKAVGANNTLVVSFALGTWTGTACSIVLANDAATGGAVLSGTMTGIGTLCARVGDVGNVAAGTGANYTIEVVHP